MYINAVYTNKYNIYTLGQTVKNSTQKEKRKTAKFYVQNLPQETMMISFRFQVAQNYSHKHTCSDILKTDIYFYLLRLRIKVKFSIIFFSSPLQNV